MTMHGVVLDARNPQGRPPVEQLAPFRLARLTAFAEPSVYEYAAQLKAAGLQVAAVITTETVGITELETHGLEIARWINPDYYVLGNEPDSLYNVDEHGQPHPSPASDQMHETAYGLWASALADGIRSVRPDARLCVAGMVSGQPWAARRYVDALRRHRVPVTALDLHLYATHSSELAAKVALYRAEFPELELCMFEWSTELADIPAFVQAIEECGITAATYHAWHETDIEGLHDHLGRRTDRYFALVEALRAITPEPGGTMPRSIDVEYQFGFAEYARTHPEVGQPEMNEAGLPSMNVQRTTNGWLIYLPESNQIVFEPKKA